MSPPRPVWSLLPLPVITPGCLDYTLFKEVVDPEGVEDTASPPPEPIYEEECFDPFLDYQGDPTPELGWTDYTQGACIQTNSPSDKANWIRVGHREIDSFVLDGVSEVQAAGAPARLVGASFGHSSGWDDSRNRVSDDVEVVGYGPWVAVGEEADVGNLNSCYPNCRFLFSGEVQDPDRADSANECDLYETTELCVWWKYYDTARTVPVSSTCEDGSGTFALVPRRAVNRDDDGSLSGSFAPVMLAGTGAMTSAAWITSVEVLEDEGQSLRAMKSGARYRFDEDDSLIDAGLVSKAILPTGVTSFNLGVVNGGTRFILQEAPATMPLDLAVELEWTCGELQDHELLLAPQGYTFELSDVGCAVSWPQKFTFRLEPTLFPDTLKIQSYGSLGDALATDLEATPAGYEFDLLTGPLRITGTIVSASPNTGAVVDLSEVSWGGTSICTPGDYTLPAEE